MRSTPQVIGAAHDAVAYAVKQVETELNGVGDNPIFLPECKLTLTGRQFPGLPRLAADGFCRRCRDDGLRALRTAPEPAHQSGPERGIARFPDQRGGDVLRH